MLQRRSLLFQANASDPEPRISIRSKHIARGSEVLGRTDCDWVDTIEVHIFKQHIIVCWRRCRTRLDHFVCAIWAALIGLATFVLLYPRLISRTRLSVQRDRPMNSEMAQRLGDYFGACCIFSPEIVTSKIKIWSAILPWLCGCLSKVPATRGSSKPRLCSPLDRLLLYSDQIERVYQRRLGGRAGSPPIGQNTFVWPGKRVFSRSGVIVYCHHLVGNMLLHPVGSCRYCNLSDWPDDFCVLQLAGVCIHRLHRIIPPRQIATRPRPVGQLVQDVVRLCTISMSGAVESSHTRPAATVRLVCLVSAA